MVETNRFLEKKFSKGPITPKDNNVGPASS